MKTVVTGGAGFIGSHLVKRLLDQGREVVIADDFSRGSKRNLLDLSIGIDCPKIDLRDFARASKAIRGAEVVFHLAARVGSLDYLHGSDLNELEALQTNLLIDTNVFKACLENKVKKLVYASSVSVYPIDLQQSANVTFSEESLRYINPEGGYGWAKLLGEKQLGWMGNMKTGIARIFNTYGENGELGKTAHVITALMRKAIRHPKEKFIVWGDGKQSRDFLYVSDCIDALLKLEEKASSPPVIVNIGSDKPVTIGSLAKKIVTLSGKDIRTEYDPTRPVGPISRTADIRRAKALLGWEPGVEMAEGLRRTYTWAEKRLNAE
ncbi:MAG: NAD-dependent epimerase/dehydratase family protein [Dehalococcoidales bacterium]|nr:NAD-dependent epimerase/dehydratase family protein [Dehalococcoidales bacterium]